MLYFLWICYAYFTLKLWLYFLPCIYINDNSYESDDLILTQMVLKGNSEVNYEE